MLKLEMTGSPIRDNAQTMSDFQKQLSDEDDDNYKYLEGVDTD